MIRSRRSSFVARAEVHRFHIAVASLTVAAAASLVISGQSPSDVPAARVDLLSFAQGAMPIRVGGNAAQMGTGDDQALRLVDGNGAPFVAVNGARPDTVVEFVYELPALTTFDRFAVPNVIEAPAAATTFVRTVEVLGSSLSPDAGVVPLASATLVPHAKRGDVTELTMAEPRPVKWIRVRLSGGLDMRGESALEFTELVGNGTQEPVPTTYRFRGEWSGGAGFMALRQQGSVVSGCFDAGGQMSGTVSGNILRAVGVNRTDNARNSFVLAVAADGTIRGLRATGTGGFRPYTVAKNAPGLPLRCTPAPVRLSCGAIVHALPFDPGDAQLHADPGGPLASLAEGLRTESSRTILIEGHVAAADGTAIAGQSLSERRAHAVVDELVRLGVPAERLRAVGLGSARPIAPGDDEASRAINRRIEVHCS